MKNQYSTGTDYRMGNYADLYVEPNKKGKVAGYCSSCGMMMIVGEEVCTRCLATGGVVVDEAPEARDFGVATWFSGKNR